MHRLSFFIAVWAFCAGTADAGTSFPAERFRHASIRDLGATADLGSDFRSLASRIDSPAWVAYSVPRVPRAFRDDHRYGDPYCGTFYLEEQNKDFHDGGDEGDTFLVLLRLAAGEVEKIRAVSTACEIDAGGLDVHAFSSVDPRQSVELLTAVADRARLKRLSRDALFAIAVHDDPSADGVLERVALGDLDWGERNQAVFWLGAARERPGFEILERLARSSDADLRHQVTFGLHASRVPEAVETLIAMARNDESRRVRSQALFWLAQEAGRRAVAEVDRAVEEDPDLEVKKYAIFALSQLPPDQGVPLLIRHARTHPDPGVRKKAMFWLGQSGDERALDFFEEILLDRDRGDTEPGRPTGVH